MEAEKLLAEPYLSKKPDSDQMKVVTSQENTIVAAGAGSGKTQTLATRFAYLVMSDEKNSVEKILTLTFTEKAAAEMYRRIYLTLKKFAEELPECAEKNRAENAVKNFSKAHIQTLDSFSMEIVKQAANLYGIRPDFSVGATDTSSVISELAFSFIMKNREAKSIQWISEAGKFQDATKYFCEAAENHTSLADSLLQKCTVFKESLKKQAEKISELFSESDSKIAHFFAAVSDLKISLDETKSNSAEIKKLRNAIQKWENSGELFERIKSQKIPSVVLEKEKAINWASSDDVRRFVDVLGELDVKPVKAKNVEQVIKCHENLFGENGIASDVLNAIDFIFNYENLRELYSLLDDFVEEVNSYKRQSGSLTFVDSTKLALRILYDQGEIRKELNKNFTKIMIDEFQDNNSSNRDLLLLISRENENGEQLLPDEKKNILEITGAIVKNRLFFVGDEKQSIYKFRGADVAVFNDLKNTIGGKILHMSNNYRSDEMLLDEFNKFFGAIGQPEKCKNYSVFSELNSAQKKFEATYSENAAAKFPIAKKEFLEKNPPEHTDKSLHRIHVCMLNTSGKNKDEKKSCLSSKESRIYFIAKKIVELNSGEQKIPFKDFAILSKSRTDYAEFARIFSLLNIPFSMDQEANIFAEAPVNDIYTALRLCVYPSDRKCYCAFLCSPFCGIDLPAAQTILAITKNSDLEELNSEMKKAFDENLEKKIAENISEENFKKYLRAKNFFNEIQDEILRKPIAQNITKLWYECGYRYAPLWTKTSEYKNDVSSRSWKQTENFMESQYDLLFELARTADEQNKDVAWFIDQLNVLQENSRGENSELDAKEVNYQTEKKDAVKIMTIHKSKGLEFPYVFICGCANENEGSHNFDGKMYVVENCAPVVIYNSLKENYFAKKAQSLEKEKDGAEFKRLVYVATTRAINHAYIVGDWAKGEKGLSEAAKEKLLFRIFDFYESNQNDAPFEFIKIDFVEKSQFNSQTNSNPVSIETHNKILGKQNALYNSFDVTKIITTPNLPRFRASPSALEEKNQCDTYTGYGYEKKAALKENEAQETPASFSYPQINSFVNSSALAKNEYGTLFHSFMEAWSKNPFEFLPEKITLQNYFFDESLVQKISEANKKILLETFCKILKTFLEAKEKNPALDALRNKREFFAEYKFKTKIHSYIFTGTIDAVFENADGTYTVLDYKTDSMPDEKIYYNQIGCYQKVAADLFTAGDVTKMSCVLFFAETGEFVDITKSARVAFEKLTDEKIATLIKN